MFFEVGKWNDQMLELQDFQTINPEDQFGLIWTCIIFWQLEYRILEFWWQKLIRKLIRDFEI